MRKIVVIIGIFLIIVGMLGIFSLKEAVKKNQLVENISATAIKSSSSGNTNGLGCRELPKTFDDYSDHESYGELEITGTGVFVYDLTFNKVLFAKNAENVNPFASFTKILTGATALSILGREEIITLPEKALLDHTLPLKVNDTWNIKELTELMMITSSNDAARAIGYAVGTRFEEKFNLGNSSDKSLLETFLTGMRAKAKAYGLESTNAYEIKNTSGLDLESGIPSVVGTVREASQMMLCAYSEYPDIFTKTNLKKSIFSSLEGTIVEAENVNQYVDELPGLLASKTGYTSSAGGNLLVLYKGSNDHIIVVGVMGSTKEDRFTDTKKLVDQTEYIVKNLRKE